MKTGWQDPLSGEIISPDIAGLQEAVGKIEDVLDMKVVNATDISLEEIYISENDHYRIYQAPGKRNWVSSPAPVIKVNGTPVSSGFTINYGGGAVVFEPPLTASDTITADFSYVSSISKLQDSFVLQDDFVAYKKDIGGKITWISANMFGVKGDSVTDDTVALQAAINYAQDNEKILYLPAGDYKITAPLTIQTGEGKPRRLQIIGEDSSNVVIRVAFAGYAFNLEMPDANTIQSMILKNFTIIKDTGVSNAYGIKINRNQKAVIENIIFRRLTCSIYASYFWTSTIRNCLFIEGITVMGSSQIRLDNQCNQLLFERCTLDAGGSDNFSVAICGSSATIVFLACGFQFGGGVTISNPSVGTSTLSGISFYGCYFEWMQMYAINISNSEYPEGVTISGCYFNANPTNPYSYAIYLGGVKGMTISSCHFVRWASNPIYSSDYAEGISMLMNTWDSSIDIINSYPKNSIVFNKDSKMTVRGTASFEMTEYRNTIGTGAVRVSSGTNAPSSGTWLRGDIIFNSSPSATGYIGWVCTAGGTPGTWKGFGIIAT